MTLFLPGTDVIKIVLKYFDYSQKFPHIFGKSYPRLNNSSNFPSQAKKKKKLLP